MARQLMGPVWYRRVGEGTLEGACVQAGHGMKFVQAVGEQSVSRADHCVPL